MAAGKQPRKKLSIRESTLARYMAIRLLASMREDSDVIDAVRSEYGVTEAVATGIVRKAWEEIVSADDGLDLQKKKGIIFMAAREHFRKCSEEKDLAQATASLRLIARIWQLDRPAPEERDKVGVTRADEMENRSSKDLRFFAQYGHWPEEEAPNKREPPKPKDPLAGLH